MHLLKKAISGLIVASLLLTSGGAEAVSFVSQFPPRRAALSTPAFAFQALIPRLVVSERTALDPLSAQLKSQLSMPRMQRVTPALRRLRILTTAIVSVFWTACATFNPKDPPTIHPVAG